MFPAAPVDDASEFSDSSDPGYQGDDAAFSDTETIDPAAWEYIEENGRKYHSFYGEYKNLMPVDEVEQDRLDLEHELMRTITGGSLFEAPVSCVNRVLDLGTGTGIWAIDYADDHPESQVFGVDISPIQPTSVPTNCIFELDNMELGWSFQENFFGFIFARNIWTSLEEPDRTLGRAIKCLEPGGYFELQDQVWEICSDDSTVPDE